MLRREKKKKLGGGGRGGVIDQCLRQHFGGTISESFAGSGAKVLGTGKLYVFFLLRVGFQAMGNRLRLGSFLYVINGTGKR